MSPRAEKLLKQLRELPLTSIREVLAELKVAEEWVWTDAQGNRAGSSAVRGDLACVADLGGSPAQIVQVDSNRWHVSVETNSIGIMPDRRAAQELAETELELRGYSIPWRKNAL